MRYSAAVPALAAWVAYWSWFAAAPPGNMSKPAWFIALAAVIAVTVGFVCRRPWALTLAAVPLAMLSDYGNAKTA